MADRIYNFSAGPSIMPRSVLETAQRELLDHHGCGISVMEMSHRSPMFAEIFAAAKAKLKKALSVPDNYEILFLQGGASLQFAGIPMNLIEGGSADYALTGNFSKKAAKEAAKYGGVSIAYDGAAESFRRIPAQSELKLSAGAKYFYYCANNTVYGTEWHYVPKTAAPLVCDMSSDILSQPVDISRFGLIYAGAQKNMAPAGLTVVIIDKALAGRQLPYTPQVMCYDELIAADSMINTPPCWCIYMLGLMLDWLESQGGVAGMERIKREKSGLIYDYLDNSALFIPHAEADSRSDMNITFRTKSAELDAEFVKSAAAKGLINLKGHKAAGGMRASLYNAMPMEGVQALLEHMKDFEVKHSV